MKNCSQTGKGLKSCSQAGKQTLEINDILVVPEGKYCLVERNRKYDQHTQSYTCYYRFHNPDRPHIWYSMTWSEVKRWASGP
jgi:hypothetical protein